MRADFITRPKKRNENFESVLFAIKSNNPMQATRVDLKNIELSYSQLNNLHAAIQINNTVGYISWGKLPQEEEASQLITQIEEKIISNNSNYRYYPTDYVYALLSSHVYEDATVGEELTLHNITYDEHLHDWRVHQIYNEAKNSYYGVIYINKKACQVVLAHRGSEFNKFNELHMKNSDYAADFRGILGGAIIAQQASAYHITKEALEFANKLGYSFSVTGHSLGAWLAENSALFCHLDFNYPQVKVVTFDSPGTLPMWEKFQSNVKNHATKFKPEHVNIVTYLSAPNVVNSCNGHIGKVYRLFPNIEFPTLIGRLVKYDIIRGGYSAIGHMLQSFILPEFNPKTGIPDRYEVVVDWPKFQYRHPPQKNQLLKQMVKTASNFLPVIGKPIEALSNIIFNSFDHTILVLTDVIMDLVKGNIDQKQYWSVMQYTEHQGGYQIREGLSNHDRFSLTYIGHYKTAYPNQRQELLYKKLFPDGYLLRLHQFKKVLINDKVLSDSTRRQLITTTALYSITKEHNRWYVNLTGNISIDILKQQVRRIVEVTPSEELRTKLDKIQPQEDLARIESKINEVTQETGIKIDKALEGVSVLQRHINDLVENPHIGTSDLNENEAMIISRIKRKYKKGHQQLKRFIEDENTASYNITEHYINLVILDKQHLRAKESELSQKVEEQKSRARLGNESIDTYELSPDTKIPIKLQNIFHKDSIYY